MTNYSKAHSDRLKPRLEEALGHLESRFGSKKKAADATGINSTHYGDVGNNPSMKLVLRTAGGLGVPPEGFVDHLIDPSWRTHFEQDLKERLTDGRISPDIPFAELDAQAGVAHRAQDPHAMGALALRMLERAELSDQTLRSL